MRQPKRFFVMVMLLVGAFATAHSTSSQDRIASLTEADLARGKALYNGQCALCHSIGGTGGRGPALNLPKLQRATDDLALYRVIKQGIPDSEMPGFWSLNEQEAWQVAGYVRALGRMEPVKITGDAARGKQLYETKGNCAACHIVRGRGGVGGPELTEIGARRSPAYLREALLEPNAATPNDYLVVSVSTADGRRVRGVRVSEDAFSLQLRETGQRLHSFRKAALSEIKKEFGVSTMPSYRQLFTAAELDDVVAYLFSLRGDQ